MATTPALIEHIRKSHAAGKDEVSIREELLRFGWKDDDIKSAFDEYSHPLLQDKKKEYDPIVLTEHVMTMRVNPRVAGIIIGVSLLIVVGVFAYQNLQWPTIEPVRIQNLYSVPRPVMEDLASSTPRTEVP